MSIREDQADELIGAIKGLRLELKMILAAIIANNKTTGGYQLIGAAMTAQAASQAMQMDAKIFMDSSSELREARDRVSEIEAQIYRGNNNDK